MKKKVLGTNYLVVSFLHTTCYYCFTVRTGVWTAIKLTLAALFKSAIKIAKCTSCRTVQIVTIFILYSWCCISFILVCVFGWRTKRKSWFKWAAIYIIIAVLNIKSLLGNKSSQCISAHTIIHFIVCWRTYSYVFIKRE